MKIFQHEDRFYRQGAEVRQHALRLLGIEDRARASRDIDFILRDRRQKILHLRAGTGRPLGLLLVAHQPICHAPLEHRKLQVKCRVPDDFQCPHLFHCFHDHQRRTGVQQQLQPFKRWKVVGHVSTFTGNGS